MHKRDGTIDKVLMEIPYSQLKKFIGMTRIKNENVSTKLGQTLENDISGNGVIQRIPPPPSSAMKGLPREDLEVNHINVRSLRSLRLQKDSCVLR